MSTRALTWAFDQKLGGRSSEKLVLIDLADHANDVGAAWPSLSRIAMRTELSERTVIRAIKSLIEWGLIEHQKRRSASGKTRSNFYILHTDRRAPAELSQPSDTVSVGDEEDSENVEVSSTSDDINTTNCHGDTCHSVTPSNCHGVTPPTDTVSPTYRRTPKVEPIYPLNPPTKNFTQEKKSTDEEKLSDSFRRLIETYQQKNLIGFLGDERKAWQTWQKMSVEERGKAETRLVLYLNGKKAQFAEWKLAPEKHNGRKPSPTESLSNYLRTKLYEMVGTPIVPMVSADEPQSEAVALCRRIIHRNSPNEEKDFKWMFVAENSTQWLEWQAFFMQSGFSEMPKRALSSFEKEHCPIKTDLKSGTIGWRFPTEYPPSDFNNAQHEVHNEKANSYRSDVAMGLR